MTQRLLVRVLVWGCVAGIVGAYLLGKRSYDTMSLWPLVKGGVLGFVVGAAVALIIDKLSGVMAPSRNTTRLILLGLGIPLTVGLAIFGGDQVRKSILLKRNWDIIASEQAKADSPARIAALQELVKSEQSLEKINLSHKILRSTDFGNANLRSANLGEADLRAADLRGADLIRAILIRADLREANLGSTRLFNAYLRGADLRGADLRGAGFFGAKLISVNLRSTNLSSANLLGVDLRGIDLRSANLSSAQMSRTNLSRTNLSSANLSSTDLGGAILLSSSFRDAKGLTTQQLDGEEPPLLCNVALPKTIQIDPNRDCDKIPERLHKLYPDNFKTLDDSKAWVNKARQKKWE